MLRSFALLTVSIWGISQAKGVLVPLILAAVLAFVLAPGVRFLRRHGVPEAWAMVCATLVFVIPLAAIAYEAVIQGEAFVRSIPQIMQHLQSGLGRIANAPWAARFHLRERLASSPWLSNGAGPGFGANLEVALRGARSFFTAGGELLLTLIFSLLMLGSRERLKRSIELILRQGRIPQISHDPSIFVNSVARLVQRFLLVRLGIAVLVGGIDFFLLLIFGVPYPLFAGAFLGFMTVIPVVGFILGLIPPVTLALAAGFSVLRIAVMLASLSVVSAVESHIVTPKLLGRHLDLNLLATFIGLFLGERLWGGWGMFLSIPVLGVIRIVLASTVEGKPWSQLLAQRERVKEPRRTSSDRGKAA